MSNISLVAVTALNDPPGLRGAIAGQIIQSNATIKPFASLSITDPDYAVSDSLTITLAGSGLSKTGPYSYGDTGFTLVTSQTTGGTTVSTTNTTTSVIASTPAATSWDPSQARSAITSK